MGELLQPTAARQRSTSWFLSATLVGSAILTFMLFKYSYGFFPTISDTASSARNLELGLSVIAWVMLLVGAPAVAWAFDAGDRFVVKFMPVIALLWPVSILLIHISLRAEYGAWYFDYWKTTPIFLLSDIAIPALYFYIGLQMKHQLLGELAEISALQDTPEA